MAGVRFLFVPRPKPNRRDGEDKTVELGQREVRKESLNLSNDAMRLCVLIREGRVWMDPRLMVGV